MQSGNDLAIWAYQEPEEHPEEYTQMLAQNVSCTTETTAAMMECLRGKDPMELTLFEFECRVSNI